MGINIQTKKQSDLHQCRNFASNLGDTWRGLLRELSLFRQPPRWQGTITALGRRCFAMM